MNDTKVLIEKIKEGIQEKKGKKIIVADLTSIEDTICKYFVICQGNSPSQVSAIVDQSRNLHAKVRIANLMQSMDSGMLNGWQWTMPMYWYTSFYRRQEIFIILNTFGQMPNLLKSPI